MLLVLFSWFFLVELWQICRFQTILFREPVSVSMIVDRQNNVKHELSTAPEIVNGSRVFEEDEARFGDNLLSVDFRNQVFRECKGLIRLKFSIH